MKQLCLAEPISGLVFESQVSLTSDYSFALWVTASVLFPGDHDSSHPFCYPVKYLLLFSQHSCLLVQILMIKNGHNEKKWVIAEFPADSEQAVPGEIPT